MNLAYIMFLLVLNVAYATQDSDFDSTQDGAAYVIMDFKQDGNFVFAFNNGETAHTNANGNPSKLSIICWSTIEYFTLHVWVIVFRFG